MDLPKTVFLNPWDQRIGPNRYLAELLHHDPRLAASSVVALPEGSDAAEEYRALGCRVEIWPEAGLLHPRLALRRLPRLLRQHSLGLWKVCRRLAALEAEVVVSNAENLCLEDWPPGA